MNRTREYLVLVVNSHVALVSRHSVKNHECSVDWCIISLFNNMVKFDCYFYYRISIILFEFFFPLQLFKNNIILWDRYTHLYIKLYIIITRFLKNNHEN